MKRDGRSTEERSTDQGTVRSSGPTIQEYQMTGLSFLSRKGGLEHSFGSPSKTNRG